MNPKDKIMVHRNKTLINFLIKILLIFVIGYLWTSDSFGSTAVFDEPDRYANQKANSLNYFWVGGSGNWSDLNHWATSSGGTVNHTILPDQNSNVLFDANSFNVSGQEVIVDVENAICADMDWSGSLNKPTLRGDSSLSLIRIKVYGYITLVENMGPIDSNLRFVFLAFSGEHTVTSAGHVFGVLNFEGSGGTWLLSDNIQAEGLNIYGGTLDSQGYDLKVGDVNISDHAALLLNNSTLEFTGIFYIYNSGIIDAGTSTIIGKKSEDRNRVIFRTSAGVAYTFYKLEFEASVYMDVLFLTAREVLFRESSIISEFHHVDKMTFLDDGLIIANGSVGTLLLSPGKKYELFEETLLKVDSLSAVGTCESPITITCTDSQQPAILEKESGVLKIEYVNLTNVKAQGGASFFGENVVATGNVAGWSIQVPEAKVLYWVGGSGEWNDSNHWSETSGGFSSGCVPRPVDDVIFDANSFFETGQEVVATTDVLCQDMNWSDVTNSPSFQIGLGRNLNIYGSLMLSPNMQFDNKGEQVSFRANDSIQMIKSAGHVLGNEIYFNEDNAMWTLTDSLTSGNEITIYNGRLITNDQNINTKTLNVIGQGELIMGNATIRLKTNFIACGYYDAGTSRLVIGVEDTDGAISWVYTGQDLFDVFFIGGRGFMETNIDQVSNFFSINLGGCRWPSAETMNVNQLTFYHDAEIQTGQIPFQAKSISIGGDALLQGDFLIDSIMLAPGSFNEFGSSTFQVKNLDVNGTCVAPIEISGGYFEGSKELNISYCIMQGVSGSSATLLSASNSIDLGSNSGWSITGSDITDLYWVGGTGIWGDQSHWSISSGGDGGACIPNITTNVHFDQNSFTQNGQEVTIDVDRVNFKSMDWTSVQFNPAFKGDSTTMMRCFGSIVLSENMTYDYQGKSIELLATTIGQTIDLAGHSLYSDVDVLGESGEWVLASDFETTGMISMYDGVFDTDGFQLIVQEFMAGRRGSGIKSETVIKLHDSKLRVTGDEFGYSNLTFNEYVEAGTSTIIMPGGGVIDTKSSLYDAIFLEQNEGTDYSRFYIDEEDIRKSFHNITFESKGSIGMVANLLPAEMTFNKITFLDNGSLSGTPFTADTLIFSAGKTYDISKSYGSDEHLIKVNKHLNVKGVSCQRITIKQLWDDEIVNIVMPSGVVNGSYLNLQGIHVSGGAQFYAGEGSEDMGDNNGWIFENAPGTEYGFLGDEKVLAVDQPTVLDATHYGVGVTYLWNTGQTTPDIEVTSCGEYSVQVLFEQGCTIYDTVNVTSSGVALIDLILEEVSNATCGELGFVKLDALSASEALSLYNIHLVSKSTGNIKILKKDESIFSDLHRGLYALQVVDSEGCFSVDQEIDIEQDSSYLPSAALANTTDATCGQKGSIEIDRSTLADIAAPYIIYLVSTHLGVESSLGVNDSKFTNLSKGSYILSVVDSAGCESFYQDDVIINLNESGCRTSVISPNFGETLTVPFKGLVNIYDRNGRLIKRFDAPGEWDGSDQNGQTVPIGSYILIEDENRANIIKVTVIR